jgi:hypothetical protein
MKLLSWKIEEKPGTKVRVETTWRDNMKRKSYVHVEEGLVGPDAPSKALIEGESAKVRDTLFGIATLAWHMGWRPPGLIQDVAMTVQNHKVTGD